MKISEYLKICEKFASETKNWYGVNPYQYYTTSGTDWQESPDNASGGLDVSWAFQLAPAEIREQAPQRFVNQLAQVVEQAIDEGWDGEQLQAVLDLMQ